MTHGREPYREVEKLLSAMVDRDLSADEAARLNDLLRNDPGAQRFYWQYVGLHLDMNRSAPTMTAGRLPAEPKAGANREQLTALNTLHLIAEYERQVGVTIPINGSHKQDDQRQRQRRRRRAWGKLAAMLLIGVSVTLAVIVTVMVWPSGSSPAPTFAVLSESRQAVWLNEKGTVVYLRDGSKLPAGTLRLADGIAKVTFDRGAVVVLDAREGGVEFEVRDERQGVLTLGRMTARVAEQRAKGFIVRTANYRVVDVGTEFGLVVDEMGEASVKVIEGVVEASRLDDEGRVISTQRLGMEEAARLPRDSDPIVLDAVALGTFVTSNEFDERGSELAPPDDAGAGQARVASDVSYHFPAEHAQNQPHPSYGDGALSKLLDGYIGSTEYNDPAWVGWLDGPDKANVFGPDSRLVQPRIEFDLGEERDVTGVEIVYLIHPRGAVYAPDRVEITLANDDQFSDTTRTLTSRDFDETTRPRIGTATIRFPATRARFVRLDFYNERQWTFLCEVRFLSAQ